VALYERAASALPTRPFFHRHLADPLLLPALADAAAELGYTLSSVVRALSDWPGAAL